MWPVERSFCLERARPSPAKSPIISRCQRSHNGPWPALRDDGRLSEGEGNNFLSPMAGSLSSGTTVMVDSHELRLLFQPRSSINSCPALVAASGVGVPFCPESATGPMAGAAETFVHVSYIFFFPERETSSLRSPTRSRLCVLEINLKIVPQKLAS